MHDSSTTTQKQHKLPSICKAVKPEVLMATSVLLLSPRVRSDKEKAQEVCKSEEEGKEFMRGRSNEWMPLGSLSDLSSCLSEESSSDSESDSMQQ
jgi:hypothetical protein